MLMIKYSRIVSLDLKCQSSINYLVFIKILDAFSLKSTILTLKVYTVNGSTLNSYFFVKFGTKIVFTNTTKTIKYSQILVFVPYLAYTTAYILN